MTNPVRPYLSVVATARNDDHGGNFLRRLQTFVNALLAQAKRHDIPMELILVELNPPPDRPRLADVVRWPDAFGSCVVRIIEVPPELHRRYRHADRLPLYQMIAKNAGIRRARGEFVLATNVDILFSDEFFHLLRDRQLKAGRTYRVDRYDVMAEVPQDAPVDERLDYCRGHLLRLYTRDGTFPLTPEGHRKLEKDDIACPASGILFGRGWSPIQQHCGVVFRWVHDDAEVMVDSPRPKSRALVLDLEPGPSLRRRPCRLQALDQSGAVLAEGLIAGRTLFRVPLSVAGIETVRLRVADGGHFVPYDLRLLNLRVFRCAWESAAGGTSGVEKAGAGRRLLRLASSTWNFARRGAHFISVLRHAAGPLRIGLPLSPALADRLHLHVEAGGISLSFDPTNRLAMKQPPRPGEESHEPDGHALHINASGDFTLMARENWLDLRAYPEFDVFSVNLDCLFCNVAHYGGVPEEVLGDPIRIYHIEHAVGSGWTPEGQAELFQRLAAKSVSWIDSDELTGWANQMRRLRAPMIFNTANWGLADFDLPETVLRGPAL